MPCLIAEEPGIRRDGSPGWFQTRKVPYGETETGIRAVLVVAFDITDQKIMNDRLMESERSKSVLLKNLKGMAYRCRYDEHWTMVFVSDGCFDLTGYQPEELIENAKISYDKVIAPEYLEMAKEKWSEGVKTRNTVELEYEIMPASGERKWVWEQGRVIFGDRDEVEAIEGLIMDISDRKRMEIHLQESQYRYDQLAAKSRTYSWEVDAEGRYSYVSSTVEAVLGYRPDEMVGHMYFYDICHPGDREERKRMGLQSIADGRDLLDGEDRVLRRDQRTLWVLCSGVAIRNSEGRVTGFRGTATDITERRKMAERIQHLALHDPLTGLPNRTLFEDRVGMALAAAQRDHVSLCLMFMDLDRFKPVNDRFGHGTGDLVLQVVARRITGILRGSDTAARIGGDEFVILLPRIRHPQDGMRVAEKIREALTAPFEIEGHELQLSASIGVAIYPGTGGEYRDLYGKADAAMYQAKKEGGNRVVACSDPAFSG
ncbi:diguanylate cyclase [Desulfobotulus sp. H1]|uniref:Diguanylate cyclase n=1 Tax=Desulfobotulus pelophilus TaxID=2823377 RepID=A0ABT3N6I5_9BACT|nr:sensor domain-containing diguanylate cyclase [Desulfobotulus pelophilus]MCW7753064.1 diguanylate cyclase [Desulfobotulus pelophilus]